MGKHPRAGIILDGLRAHGDDVLEINEPLGFSTAERVAMLQKSWSAHRLLTRTASRWFRLTRRGLRRTRLDAVLVGYLGHFDVLLARLIYPRTTIALDLMIFAADTAQDRGTTGGVKLRLLDALDRLAIRCSDIVIVDTEEHLGLIPEAARSKGIVIPVGATEEWFAAGASEASAKSDGLRVVFYGLYTPLQGAAVIGTALTLLAADPSIQVTMIGTGQDYEQTRKNAADNPAVTWLDWVEAADLPALVAAHDVCLGIFGTTAKSLRVVPNKVYQGAAAGCAIVTSDTAPQRRTFGASATYVAPGDAAALARSLRTLAEDPDEVSRLRAAARSLANERFTAAEIVQPLRARLAG